MEAILLAEEEDEGPLPPSVAELNVSFCKIPFSRNFGIPVQIVKWRRICGTGLRVTPGTAYTLMASGKNRPSVKCLLCNESFSVKSNLAVAEELARFNAYLAPPTPICCPTPGCANPDIS